MSLSRNAITDPKAIKAQLEVLYKEEIAGGLLAYGLCKKEGRTMGANQRLLVLSETNRTIGYCNEPPKEIPVGEVAKIKLKHTARLMTCETRITSDNKSQLNVNVQLQPEKPSDKPKKDRWVMNFPKPQTAKEWDDLIKSIKLRIREGDLLSSKKPTLPPGAMVRSEYPIAPNLATIEPRQPQPSQYNPLSVYEKPKLSEELPIDSYIRQINEGESEQPSPPHEGSRMIQSRTEVYDPRQAPPPPPPPANISRANVAESTYGSQYGNQPRGVGGTQEDPRKSTVPQPRVPSLIPLGQNQSNIGGRSSIKPKPPPIELSESEGQIPARPAAINSSQIVIPPGSKLPQPRGSEGASSNAADWNVRFAASSDPISTILQFEQLAQEEVVRLINELGLDKSIRKGRLVDSSEGLHRYDLPSIEILLALDNPTEDTRRLLKNEWRNYNYILGVTQNKGLVRVPLACIVEHKGVTGLAKAKVLNGIELDASTLSNEFAELERLSKVSRDVFSKDERVRLLKTRADDADRIYVWNLYHFIPVDLYSERQLAQLRQETIETLDRPVGSGPIDFGGSRKLDRSQVLSPGLREAGDTMRSYAEQVLGLLETFEIVILNTKELVSNFHLNGVNIRTLGEMHKRAHNPLVKKYLMSEMVARACAQLLRQELQGSLIDLGSGPSNRNAPSHSEAALLDIAFSLLNNIVSNNHESDRLWKAVSAQTKSRFGVSFSKEDLVVGFFLSSLFDKANLLYNYDMLLKDREYLRAANLLKPEFVKGFNVKTRSYQIGWTGFAAQLDEVLNVKPSRQGCQQLISMLGLQSNPIPSFCDKYGYDTRVRLYLSHFINCDLQLLHGQEHAATFKHLDLYRSCFSEPPTFRTVRLALQAIKWELNFQQNDKAQLMFDTLQDLLAFWGGESHPLLGELYDVFAAQNGRLGEYEKAMDFAKSSIQNAVKLAGSNSLIAANKYYEYGLLCFKAGRKDDALANFIKVRQINQTQRTDDSPEHAKMCMKMSLLYLNLNQNSECLARALECLKIIERLPDTQEDQVNVYELLFRQYEVTDQKTEMANLATTVAKKLKHAKDPQTVSRMLKIVIHPTLRALSAPTRKQLADVVVELKQKRSSRLQEWKKQAYQSYYLKSEQDNFALGVLQKFAKVDRHLAQITSKRMVSSYSGPEQRSTTQSEQFLQDLDIVCCQVGDGFMVGLLRQDD